MRYAVIGTVIAVILIALVCWRIYDHAADRAEVQRLRELQPANPPMFEQAMIADLPEPVRRFFAFSIAEGAPLLPVAEIEMAGQFSLGEKNDPSYMKMRASEVLAVPEGFVWKMRAQSGHLRFSGSDSGKWTRFWMGELLPVAHAGGDPDHARSAFGRAVAEAVFWSPAAVLPSQDVVWDAVGPDTARVTVTHDGLVQSVDITVAADGQPTEVVFQRWSNANPQREYRRQPFGGYLSGFKWFQGYHLPTHVEAGDHFGTDAYFPFFRVDVTDIMFPQREP